MHFRLQHYVLLSALVVLPNSLFSALEFLGAAAEVLIKAGEVVVRDVIVPSAEWAAKQLSAEDHEAEFAKKIFTKVIERCDENIAQLEQGTSSGHYELKPLNGYKEHTPTLNMSIPSAYGDPTEPYAQVRFVNSQYGNTKVRVQPSAADSTKKKLMSLSQTLRTTLLKQQIKPKEKISVGQILDTAIKSQANKGAKIGAAAAQAQVQAEASERMLKKILSPQTFALGVGAFGSGVALYHLFPRLIAKKPDIISEMSFLSPFDRLMGKKLPTSNFEQIVFPEDLAPQIMRTVAHIRRVVNSGGEMMNLIFFGPPGTGKTMSAKAIARSVGADYMLINASAFEQLTPGQAVSELEATFRLARQNKKPVLVFFDEADAVMGRRGSGMETQTSRRVINTFLANVTDTHNRKIMFVLATNIPKSLDAAVLSRFPEEGWFYFGPPSAKNRATILRNYLEQFAREGNLTLGDDVITNLDAYAQELDKATGRDLRAIARSVADRMVDEGGTILTDDVVRKTLHDIKANKKHMEQYAYTSPSTTTN